MNSSFRILCALLLSIASPDIYAQQWHNAGEQEKNGAKGVNNTTKQAIGEASSLNSQHSDKEITYKMGPGGERVYLSSDGRHYYEDNRGERVYMNDAELRTIPPKPKSN